PSFQAAVHSSNAHHQNSVSSRATTSVVIGTSMYDLQTNASVCNRIVLNADGTVAATWTMSHDAAPTSSPDRGTGYNYFNGTAWGAPPATRIETIRCGWPNIAVTATGGEVIVSHEATSGIGNMHVLTRPVKGTGLWNDTTLGYPDVWPRMVVGGANGNTVHIISQTTGVDGVPFHGQDGAIAYSRSLDGGITWDKYHTVIAAIDSSNYLGFGGDSYAIDAKGDTIVIVAGGFDVDVVLLKSIDNGTTWTKTIVKQFPIALYSSETMTTDVDNDQIADTLETNDASVAVLLDNQGKAHVWFGRMRVICDDPGTASGQGLSYFPGTDGLYYWNEDMTTGPGVCAFAQDIDDNQQLDVGAWGSYQTSLSSMPSAGIDPAGNIYLSYGSIYEGISDDGTVAGGKSYRHTYLLRSSDNGVTWCGPINVVDPDNDPIYDYTEGVFGAISKNINDKVHLIYQKDSSPGHALGTAGTDPQSGNESEIVYVTLPITDFDAFPANTCDSLFYFPVNVGIKESKENGSTVNLYPNPATNSVNLLFNLSNAEKVNVRIYNVVGQELSNFEKELQEVNYSLNIKLENYKQGVYFVKSTIKGKLVTKKLVVE
ncbi:MAG: T9SS type A sorting domain-containing protein, partial [Bacteroidetes bacterium]|nr:T9SS type A sorting domain-containing protein [Bacteroidota bacterium]